MNNFESLGDRMKSYESLETERKAMMGLPTLLRLDGRAFHTFCHGLNKPFDLRLNALMNEVTKFLVDELHARIGYVQSDEISLALSTAQPLFDGRYQKLTSIAAGLASAKFNQLLPEFIPEKVKFGLQVFDARAWAVPSKAEAAHAFLWRERDATKNSISMLAQKHFSHKELQGKDGRQMQAMLLERFDINWNDLDARCKRGAFFRRVSRDMEPLPELRLKLEAKGLAVPEYITRSSIEQIPMPPFGTVLNREEVIFNGADPIVATQGESDVEA